MIPHIELKLSAALSLRGRPPGLLDLPPELFEGITSRLSIRSLARLAAASKDLRALLQPQLYIRDHNNGSPRALVWAVCSSKAHAVDTLERASTYWPHGTRVFHRRIKSGKIYNGRCWRDFTPLLAAVQAGNYQVVRFLLSAGVNISKPEYSAHRDTLWYPIHYAVMWDSLYREAVPHPAEHELNMIKLLLDEGANPDQLSLPNPNPRRLSTRTSHGMITPIHLAIVNGANDDTINVLLQSGASTTLTPYRNALDQPFSAITPVSHLITLHDRPSATHYRAVQLLLRNSFPVDGYSHVSTSTRLPLLLECLGQPRTSPESIMIAEAVLSNSGGRTDETASNGDSVIVHFLRAHIGWRPVVTYDRKLLLRHEEKHLMAGTSTNTCAIIDMLLQHQANIDRPGAGGQTALHIAAGLHRHYSSILFPYLIRCGANVGATTSDGQTILHSLVVGDFEADWTLVTTIIKKYKIDRYARDEAGNTFLHLVVSQPISAFDKWMGQVAKHYRKGDFDDPKLQNKAGRTPLEEACLIGGDGKGNGTRFWIKHAFEEVENSQNSSGTGAQSQGKKGRKKKKGKSAAQL